MGMTPGDSSYDTKQPNPFTPFTSDNESHPTGGKKVVIKYISYLNQPPYQSIPDDGDCELPKLIYAGFETFKMV